VAAVAAATAPGSGPGAAPARDPHPAPQAGGEEPTQRNSLSTTSPGRAGAQPWARPDAPGVVQLQEILSVLPVERLRGGEAPAPSLPPDQMIQALLAAASARPGEGEGTAWGCRFLSSIDPRMAKVKLDLLWERDKFAVDARDKNRIVARLTAPAPPPPSGLFRFGKRPAPPPPAGLEVVVQFAEPGRPVGEFSAEGRLFGDPPADFAAKAERVIVSLLEGIQRHLGNISERRQHPRFPAEFPVLVYPMHGDGRIDAPLSGRCRDVSAGGVALRLGAVPPTKYAYVAFEGARATAGLALLTEVVRTRRDGDGILATGRYRPEMWPPAAK
jgi:hypothetical protein